MPTLDWNENYTELNYILVGLYRQNKNDAYTVAEKAGINAFLISDLDSGNIYTFWHSLIKGALAQGKLITFIETILGPNERGGAADPSIKQTLEQILNNIKTNAIPISNKNPASVKGEDDKIPGDYEKLMESKSTLLPISFLEKGWEYAKAVVRIVIRIDQKNRYGSGFLINGNWLITNNHVLPSIEIAEKATIQFNYQKDIRGLDLECEEYTLLLDEGCFYTDSIDDWTIVKLNGDANKKYGAVILSEVPAIDKDFVNIIQHPSGGHKQIAMYHNTVTSVTEKYVWYLTDTLPGSSGSPVFNSEWEVVAIHHWGGSTIEAFSNLTVYRNRGINILKLRKALNDLHIA